MSDKPSDPVSSAANTSQQKADLKPTPTAAPAPPLGNAWINYGAKKAEPVLTREELGRIRDLGLGRGVDATDQTPWLNKRAFQVRPVTFESVIGTEEGGALQSYEKEVTSLQTQQSNLKLSIAQPTAPVRIGMDEEYSRSATVTRQAIGRRVITRSVAFNKAYEDDITSPPSTGSLQPAQGVEASAMVVRMDDNVPFERWLSSWIIKRYKQKRGYNDCFSRSSEDPVGALSAYLRSKNGAIDELNHHCSKFVTAFKVTHYVTEIQLGAAEYRVLSQSEYYSKIGLSGTLGVDKLANVVLSQSNFWKKTTKASDIKRIGIISDEGVVTRGSYGEAVVGVKMEPLTCVVRLPELHKALQQALIDYVDKQEDTSSGPFLVSCNEGKLYWTVDKDHFAINVTDKMDDASWFYLFPHDEGSHPFQFIIGYHEERKEPKTSQVSIPRFLQVASSIFGNGAGPLRLRYNIDERASLLALHDRRLVTGHRPVDPLTWTRGEDIFYLYCRRRKCSKGKYVCVRRSRGARYVVCCRDTSFLKNHDEAHDYMLFRLQPVPRVDEGEEVVFKHTASATIGQRDVSRSTKKCSGELNSHDIEMTAIDSLTTKGASLT